MAAGTHLPASVERNRSPIVCRESTAARSSGSLKCLTLALYYNVFAGGVRPVYSIDAMAVIYMVMVLSVLLVALRFVRPTQMVFRLDQPRR